MGSYAAAAEGSTVKMLYTAYSSTMVPKRSCTLRLSSQTHHRAQAFTPALLQQQQSAVNAQAHCAALALISKRLQHTNTVAISHSWCKRSSLQTYSRPYERTNQPLLQKDMGLHHPHAHSLLHTCKAQGNCRQRARPCECALQPIAAVALVINLF